MKLVLNIKRLSHFIFTTVFSFGMIWCANWFANFLMSMGRRGVFDLAIISIHKVKNTGAAFNLLSNNPNVIIGLSFIALFSILLFVIFNSNKLNSTISNSLGVLTAGIGMNFFERITKGYVTDYIDLNFIPNTPVFNVADIFIILGTTLLICALFTKK